MAAKQKESEAGTFACHRGMSKLGQDGFEPQSPYDLASDEAQLVLTIMKLGQDAQATRLRQDV